MSIYTDGRLASRIINNDDTLLSIAISLKRIADLLEDMTQRTKEEDARRDIDVL